MLLVEMIHVEIFFFLLWNQISKTTLVKNNFKSALPLTKSSSPLNVASPHWEVGWVGQKYDRFGKKFN